MASSPFDPRVTPARSDLAAKYLEGKVKADRFVEGVVHEVFDAIAPVRRSPTHDARLETEALKGERVTIYDRNDEGWAWGQLQRDGYVGWLPDSALVAPRTTPSHKIIALRTFAFPGPSIKLPPVEILPLGALVEIVNTDEHFAITRQQHYIPMRHVARLDVIESDFVSVAERFLGTPYLWGGRTNFGIDCSGLVQTALAAIGINAPRDSDMQEVKLGASVSTSDYGSLRRGDLMFWKGHVAIIRDKITLIHANAFHMETAIETIEDAILRIKAFGNDVTTIKRMG